MKAVKFFAPVAVAALMVCGTARAYVSLLDSSMYPALTNTTGSVINGVTFAALALGGDRKSVV